MTDSASLVGVFLDPEGPFGLSADLLTNAATETAGVVFSILISVFFAVWLDRRFERSRKKRQMLFLLDQLLASYHEVNIEIPKHVSQLVENNKISSAYGTFSIYTKRTADNARQLIDFLLANHGLDIETECVGALNDAKFNFSRIFDIADMETSISLRDAIANNSLEAEGALLQEKYAERLTIIRTSIHILAHTLHVARKTSVPDVSGLRSDEFLKLLSYAKNEYFSSN